MGTVWLTGISRPLKFNGSKWEVDVIRLMLLTATIVFMWPTSAKADISDQDIISYNSALQSGDSQAMQQAARKLADAVLENPDHPDASLLAFEVAWALCRTGDCAAAKPAATFASEHADAPQAAALLNAYIAWKVAPDRTNYKALTSELSKIEASPPTSVSVSAFRDVYVSALKTQDWLNLSKLAERAAEHFRLGGDPVPQFRTEAKLLAVSAAFNYAPRAAQLSDMAHLRGELRRMRRLFKIEHPDEDYPEWMESSYWSANAWEVAMSAYFLSIRKKAISDEDIEEIVDSYVADLPVEPDDEDAKLPMCKGTLVQKPMIKYPAIAGFRGRVGSVILGFRFESDGKVTDAKVLAAVPTDGFRDEVIKAVSQWYFKPDEDPATAGCRLDHDKVVQSYAFAIQ